MPIPEDVGPSAPQADSRLIAYVERRREEEARVRRQRWQLIAIACLGGIVVILTVSNAVLLSRLLARPPVPPVVALAPVTAPARPSAPAPASAPAPEGPSPTAPPADAPAPPAAAIPPAAAPTADTASLTPPSEGPLVLPEPRTPQAARTTRSPVATRPPATALPSSSADPAALAGDTDPARRTARWLVDTYGPLEAEGRALTVAEFYTGADREFWRRVAHHVRADR